MTRASPITSLIIIVCAVVAAYLAFVVGARVAGAFAEHIGFAPLLLLGVNFLALVGLVVFAFAGLHEGLRAPDGLPTALCAAISLICGAYVFGLARMAMPVDLFRGSNLWAATLVFGLLPLFAMGWGLLRGR